MPKGNEQQKPAGPKFPKPVKSEPKSKVPALPIELVKLSQTADGLARRFENLADAIAAGAPITRAQATGAANSLRIVANKAGLMERAAVHAGEAKEREVAKAKSKLDRAHNRLNKALADTNLVRKEQGLAPLGADGKEVAE